MRAQMASKYWTVGIRLISFAVFLMLISSFPVFAESFRTSGTGSSLAAIKHLAKAFRDTSPNVEVEIIEPSMGSGGSLKGLSGGFLEVAFAGRPLKAKEKAAGLTARLIARTPFVFATARSNTSVDGLTLRKLADIYAGRSTVWPDGRRIRLILRPRSDSSTPRIKAMSPEMAAAIEAAIALPGIDHPMTDQIAGDRIATVPGAMGSSTLALIVSENRPLRALAIDGVAPTVAAMEQGTYPYSKPLYLVVGPGTGAAARRFADFAASDQARAVLAGLGYGTP